MILVTIAAKMMIICMIVKKITQIVVIVMISFIDDSELDDVMHYFHFDDQGNIRYFMDRSKVGITYHKRGFKEAKNNA